MANWKSDGPKKDALVDGMNGWPDRCCFHTTCDHFWVGAIDKLTLLCVFVCGVEYFDVLSRENLLYK